MQVLTVLRDLATTEHRDVTPAIDYIHMTNAVLYSFPVMILKPSVWRPSRPSIVREKSDNTNKS